MLTTLELTVILLVAAVVAVATLRRFAMPPLVAYLAVGVLLGPHAANLAGNQEAVQDLGEIGVVFLMFSLGLEFSLPKLRAMRAHVMGLGGAQVLTTVASVVALILLMPSAWRGPVFGADLDWRAAIAIGGAVAMSSTALVSKLLTEKRELETEHGRRIFAVLLFQDLAVIPLLVVIPALAGRGGHMAVDLTVALLKAAVLLLLLLRFGPVWMGRWFNAVARQRSHELFTLNVLLATLLFAWLTHEAGLSLELGAFVAGMLIAETEFRFQVEEDIKPFRDVLLGLFFVAIGMQLNLQVVLEMWPRVLAFLTLPILLKFALIACLARALGAMTGTAVRTGVWLSQAGEFGFVLLSQAVGVGLLPDAVAQPMLAAMLLSLLVSPLLIQQAGRIALRLSGSEWLQRSLQLQRIASSSLSRERHVIICGFGRSGQALAHVLEAERVPYLALDLDPDRVRQAADSGESALYGDVTRLETLQAAGLHRAAAAVITFDDLAMALRTLHQLRTHAPALPVLVRTTHEADIERLRAAGATEVVPEVAEGSLMLASHLMLLADVPADQVQARVARVRADRYALLRGFFRGGDDQLHEQIDRAPLHLRSIALGSESSLEGQPLAGLEADAVRVVAVVRAGQRIIDPPDEWILRAGDLLVVSGTIEQIGAADARIRGQR